MKPKFNFQLIWPALTVAFLVICRPVLAETCQSSMVDLGPVAVGHYQVNFTVYERVMSHLKIRVYLRVGQSLNPRLNAMLNLLNHTAQKLETLGLPCERDLDVILFNEAQPVAGHGVIVVDENESPVTWVHEFFHTVLNHRLAKISAGFSEYAKILGLDNAVSETHTYVHLQKMSKLQDEIDNIPFLERKEVAIQFYKAADELDRYQSVRPRTNSIWNWMPIPYHELICDLGARAVLGYKIYEPFMKERPQRSFDPNTTAIISMPTYMAAPHDQLPQVRQLIAKLLSQGVTPELLLKTAILSSEKQILDRAKTPNLQNMTIENMNENYAKEIREKLKSADSEANGTRAGR